MPRVAFGSVLLLVASSMTFACGGLVTGSEAESDAGVDAGGVDAQVPPGGQDAGAEVGPRGVDAGGIDAREAAASCPPGTSFFDGGCDLTSVLPSTAACLVGGNVLWVDGDLGAYIFEGTETIAGGPWAAGTRTYGGTSHSIAVVEVGTQGATGWYIQFNTNGTYALETGVVYWPTTFTWDVNASRQANGPNFDIELGFTGCPGGPGAFRLDAFDVTTNPNGDIVESITASFWVHCDGHTGIVRGCLHYDTTTATSDAGAPTDATSD